MEPYTVALTSCGRFDLLERTLTSLLPRLEGPVERILIAEDSGDRRVQDVVRKFDVAGVSIDVTINDPPLGQIKSIDRLYTRLETEWIFHCEDDWEFCRDGFIKESFDVLRDLPNLSVVSLLAVSDFPRLRFQADPSGRYHIVDPAKSYGLTGLHFAPGLRRLSDYRLFAPFARVGTLDAERIISDSYAALGFRVACLSESAVRHIGDNRHVRNPSYPRGLNRAVQKRMLRLRERVPSQSRVVKTAKKRLRQRDRTGAFLPHMNTCDE